MKIGIVGLPMSGKTTFFRLLTHTQPELGKGRSAIGMAMVPDARVDYLSAYYKPRKIAYAQIAVTDVPGIEAGRSEFINELRDVDLLVQVVRAFTAAHVPSQRVSGPDPLADAKMIQEELALADWSVADTRLTRLRKGSRQPQTEADLQVFTHITNALESGQPLRKLELNEEQREALQGISFLSDKPCLVVVNTDEQQFRSGNYPGKNELAVWCDKEGMPLLEVCGQLEMEMEELDGEDKAAFLADLGVEETGLTRLARAAYELLGLISFFTVGEDEVKAWTVRKGSSAKEAAGKIHSDIARGFIRAEVVPYTSFVEHNGFRVRENGGPRLEGRDYIVEDGDIMHIRFNV